MSAMVLAMRAAGRWIISCVRGLPKKIFRAIAAAVAVSTAGYLGFIEVAAKSIGDSAHWLLSAILGLLA